MAYTDLTSGSSSDSSDLDSDWEETEPMVVGNKKRQVEYRIKANSYNSDGNDSDVIYCEPSPPPLIIISDSDSEFIII